MSFDNDIVDVYYSLMSIARRSYYHDERADDLAAEAVCRALEHKTDYDTSRPLLTWCRAIMRNLYINTETRLSSTLTTRMGDWDEPGNEQADQQAIVGDMRSAIAKARRKSVCVDTLLEFARGYSIAEISEFSGLPEGTVKRRIHEARHMLRDLVK